MKTASRIPKKEQKPVVLAKVLVEDKVEKAPPSYLSTAYKFDVSSAEINWDEHAGDPSVTADIYGINSMEKKNATVTATSTELAFESSYQGCNLEVLTEDMEATLSGQWHECLKQADALCRIETEILWLGREVY